MSESNNNAMNAEQVDTAERQLGRKITPSEILVGRNLAKRIDARTSREKMEDAQNFRVVMAQPATEKTAAEVGVETAEAMLATERASRLSPAERRLEMMKSWRAAEVTKAQQAELHRQHLAKPAITGAVKSLEQLRASLEFRPETTVRQLAEIDAAISQLTVQGADPSVGLDRTRAIFDARKSAMQKQHDERLALIRRQIDLADGLRQEIEAMEGPTADEPAADLEKLAAEQAEIEKQRESVDANIARLMEEMKASSREGFNKLRRDLGIPEVK
jgi:hypothetical protein